MFSKGKLSCYILLLLLLAGCSITSKFHLSLAVSDKQGSAVAPPVSASAKAISVSGKHCRTKASLPLLWEVDMNEAMKKALSKAPGAVALGDITVYQKVYSFVVYNRICTEVVGLPLYSLNH